MPGELVSALCLVAVIEGLVLFALPGLWRQTMQRLGTLPSQRLRQFGGLVMVAGLALLWWVRMG